MSECYNFKKADNDLINSEIDKIYWNVVLNSGDVDTKVDIFY